MMRAVWIGVAALPLLGGCASYSKQDLAEDACWLLPKCEDGVRSTSAGGPPHAQNIENGGFPQERK